MKLLRREWMLSLMCLVVVSVAARQREKSDMLQTAADVLNTQVAKARGANRQAPLREFVANRCFSVVGYDEGGFVVVSADDVAPEVLGYSSDLFSAAGNPNFEWWLAAMQDAIEGAIDQGQPLPQVKPDPTRYPTYVPPLVTSKWGQDAPYNNLCPVSSRNQRCLTGCVATAMAQVLYYHKFPPHGRGKGTIYYPYRNTRGTAVTADFGNTYYDWENMLERYSSGRSKNYTEAQGHAVAELMVHCGVASDMQYGDNSDGGSGAYMSSACYGLQRYFGFEDAAYYERSDYGEASWMDKVFTELSQNRPILYGGADASQGGHAFVLDGYDSQGMVSVNWGWEGSQDGFYNIAALNPSGYRFSTYQDMITGVSTGVVPEFIALEVQNAKAGALIEQLDESQLQQIVELKVSGDINSTDLGLLRTLAGNDTRGEASRGYLSKLDLSDARIVSGGTPYLAVGGEQYYTQDDQLPPLAFYSCQALNTLKLPRSLKRIDTAAFLFCFGLSKVEVDPADDQEFVIDGNVVYSHDTTEVITALPYLAGTAVLPQGVQHVREYAFSTSSGLKSVELPATVATLGDYAFYNTPNLQTIKMRGCKPCTAGSSTFLNFNDKGEVYVPTGTRRSYMMTEGWLPIAFRFKEYGTVFSVSDASRTYGEANPEFKYTKTGDKVTGEPVVVCLADSTSPAGTYPITFEMGTLEGGDIIFDQGTLTVNKAPLQASVGDYERNAGEENPVFEVHYDGFVNGDDASAIAVPPTVSTTATAASPAGEYVLMLSGGEAQSYDFSYTNGTLTVNAVTVGISSVKAGAASGNTYTVDGRQAASSAAPRKAISIRGGRKFLAR